MACNKSWDLCIIPTILAVYLTVYQKVYHCVHHEGKGDVGLEQTMRLILDYLDHVIRSKA